MYPMPFKAFLNMFDENSFDAILCALGWSLAYPLIKSGMGNFKQVQMTWEEKLMSSILIKDTTKEERIALIKSWIPHDDGLEDCDIDLWDMYADYINGKREIAEINMSFEPKYVEE